MMMTDSVVLGLEDDDDQEEEEWEEEPSTFLVRVKDKVSAAAGVCPGDLYVHGVTTITVDENDIVYLYDEDDAILFLCPTEQLVYALKVDAEQE